MNRHWGIRLGDVAQFIRGLTYKPGDVLDKDDAGAVPCMRTKNIQERLEDDDLVYIPDRLVRDRQWLEEGDILVSSANSWNLVGKCSWVPRLGYRATFGGFTSILRADPRHIDARYLYHWFSWDHTQTVVRSFGQQTTNISNLNQNRCLDLALQLPPLNEQRRIAAILDKADALRQKRKRAIALLDSLTQSIFLEMFGDPKLNPKKMPTITLGDLLKVKSGDGLTSAQMDPSGEFTVYGGNGPNGQHSKYMFEEPQIVIGRVGVYCGAVHITKPKSWVTDNALYVSNIRLDTNQTYLAWALRLADLNQLAGRAAQPLISGGRIYPVEILLPAIQDQNEFSKAIQNVAKVSGLLDEPLIEALFSSLQHRAFSGQL